VTSTGGNSIGIAADALTCSPLSLTRMNSSSPNGGSSSRVSTNATGPPRDNDVATTHTAFTCRRATCPRSALQSIQRSRLAASGVGSSRLARRTPGISSASPTKRISVTGSPRPTIGRITSPLLRSPQRSSAVVTRSEALMPASDASSAALIAPTLVPQNTDTRSPRASSAGSSTLIAPIS
jgi:hypothetical protein